MDDDDDGSSRIVVRRFAGHASHADHFDEPLRVVHLTDQHVGRVTSMQTQKDAVARANAFEDVVARGFKIGPVAVVESAGGS